MIEGHNIFRFDLEYIEARARRHGVRAAVGARRQRAARPAGAALTSPSAPSATAATRSAGRHVVDTWMLAQLHDVGARDLPSFGLKDIARHLGRGRRRPHVRRRLARSRAQLAEVARPAHGLRGRRRAGDARRGRHPGAARTSSRPSSLPFDYQSATLRGAAAKIDTLLLREYLRRGHAVPAPGVPASRSAAASPPSGNRASAAPVLHVDVTSLYPSLMLAGGIAPASRRAGRVPRAARSPARRPRARQAPGPQCRRPRASARTSTRCSRSFKILINAFYGYLAFSRRPLQRLRRRRSGHRRGPRGRDGDRGAPDRARRRADRGRHRRRLLPRRPTDHTPSDDDAAAGGRSPPSCPRASRSSSTAATPRCSPTR